MSATSSRITITEIQNITGLGERTVYDLLKRGIIPGIQPQRKWIVSRQAFNNWWATAGTKQTGVMDKIAS